MSSLLRNTNLQKLSSREFDVCIVGAGINGAVSAAALAAQGVDVALIDKGDFGGATSSQSSNLAWGGIKYLETWEFPLVWKLCKSRNHLVRNYPSTVKEIRFLTTIQKGFRFPPLLVFMGALLYWVMGRFATRPPLYLSRRQLAKRESHINMERVQAGVEYSDCYLHDNDTRFVFNFVRSAMDFGAIAANYVGSTGARFEAGMWTVTCRDEETGAPLQIRANALVNACGPKVDSYNQLNQQTTQHHHLFSKGVHLIVDRITEHRHIMAFFASDGRLFFVIPMGPKTCIGTTDTQVSSPEVGVSDADRHFILDNANKLLKLATPLTAADIIAERCGVRPLAVAGGNQTADWVALSRKHAIDTDFATRQLSIFGGKLTDCLNVGNEVAELIEKMGIRRPYPGHKWYGEPDASVRAEFLHQARLMDLDSLTGADAVENLSDRLWRRYGATAFEMLESIRENPRNAQRMIEHTEYLRCEIDHIRRREMITRLEDFLRRRSKISLVVPHAKLLNATGLTEACEALFGVSAAAQLADYVADHMTEHMADPMAEHAADLLGP